MKRVGILVGREQSFPEALIAEIGRRDEGVVGEYATIDLVRVDRPPPHEVLVDRISHDVECYRPVLKCAALAGARVINDPFWRIADDKALDAALADRLKIPVPKTYVLPSKEYGSDVTSGSLRNLAYPLSWDALAKDLGFPMFVKPHWGGGFRDVHRVASMEQLMRVYDASGRATMIAQEAIEWTQYVRCVVVGRRDVLALRWDPRLSHFERYVGARESMPPLDAALHATIERHARALCDALGYDMNTVEFAVKQGVPYAIDFMNSAPDFDVRSLGEESFGWTVKKMAELCVRLAKEPRVAKERVSEILTRG